MEKYSQEFPIRLMAKVLDVSVSGYYSWLTRKPSQSEQYNQLLSDKIGTLFFKHHRRYGSPRITKALNNDGLKVNKKRVARLMREQGWRAKASKRYKATTNSHHDLPVAPNLLKQNFTASAPNEKWASDITYIWTDEGWLYLAVILDLYSRKIIGWSQSNRMTRQLVIDALNMALWRRKMPEKVILHSDRGSQYCSADYQKLLKKYNLRCSMSKKGDCYDNSMLESWNHSLKVEAIHGEKFKTRDEAKAHIFEYIELYYNRIRLHSGLGYLTPEQFEQKVA